LIKFFFQFVIIIGSLIAVCSAADSSEKTFGLLVKVKKNITFEVSQKKLSSILKTHGLRFHKYYKKFRVLNFKYKTPVEGKEKVDHCELVRAFDFVEMCSPEKALKLSEESNGETLCPLPQEIHLGDEITSIIQAESCEISPKLDPALLPGKPEFPKGLSMFWAQEYTGADLVRKKMEKMKESFKVPENFLALIDNDQYGKVNSEFYDHGHHCSNLIAGPTTGIIPLNQSVEIDFNCANGQVMMDQIDQLTKENPSARYINFSMSTSSNEVIASSLEEMIDETKTVLVKAAGNNNQLSEDVPFRGLANRDKVIIVGSLSPDGSPSSFSSFGEELTISAPSDHFVISTNRAGKPQQFGGTSGATPQVTSALAAFELISGYPLTTTEAKRLLEKTALPNIDLPVPNAYGHGMLNAAFIAKIAEKLKIKCESSVSCMKEALANDELFEKENNLSKLSQIGDYFPTCHRPAKEIISTKDCFSRKAFFDSLREDAFASNNPELWQAISCISALEGHSKNSEYYGKLAKRYQYTDDYYFNKLSQEQIKRNILSLKSYRDKYPSMYKDFFKKALADNSQRRSIVEEVFSIPDLVPASEKLNLLAQTDRIFDQSVIIESLGVDCLKDDDEFKSLVLKMQSDGDQKLSSIMSCCGRSPFRNSCWEGNEFLSKFIESLLSSRENLTELIYLIRDTPHLLRDPKAGEWIKKLISLGYGEMVIEHIISKESFFKQNDFDQIVSTYLQMGREDVVIKHLLTKNHIMENERYQKLFDDFYQKDEFKKLIMQNILSPSWGEDKSLLPKDKYQKVLEHLMVNPENYQDIINAGILGHPYFKESDKFVEYAKRILSQPELIEGVGEIFENPYWIKNEPEEFLRYQRKNPQDTFLFTSVGDNLNLFQKKPEVFKEFIENMTSENVRDLQSYILVKEESSQTPWIVTDLLSRKILSKKQIEEIIRFDHWKTSPELNSFLDKNPELDPRNENE
jgi:hypothetical protein